MIVLDNTLYAEYHKFKNPENGEAYNTDTISRILRFAGNSILTNFRQWRELGFPENSPLAIALKKKARHKNLDLPSLAQESYFKIILTDDPSKKDFPYVNIQKDDIEPTIGGFIHRNTSRGKAIAHFKSLLLNASELIIYDNYFANRKDENIKVLTSIIPLGKKIKMIYDIPKSKNESPIDKDCIDKISEIRPDVSFEQRALPPHHDRYIIIDNATEIILTSGFDHLSLRDKELSYIIRQYTQRFSP